MNRDFAQSKILEAELCLALNDFATAKKIILEVVKTDPDNYLLTLMAAAERGSGSPDSVVHEWLAKAAYAPKSKAWICKNCNFQTEWVCVCPKCECFDSIEWTRPQDYSQNDLDQIQIPFILKTDERNGLSTEGEFLASEDSDSPGTSAGQEKFQPKLETNIVKKAREIN